MGTSDASRPVGTPAKTRAEHDRMNEAVRFQPYDDAMQVAERRYWTHLLLEHSDNVTQVARAAGKNRTWTYTRFRAIGLKRDGANARAPRESRRLGLLGMPLSRRERQVLTMMCNGMRQSEMAAALFRSEKTIQAHRGRIREKTGTRTPLELALWAIRNGIEV